MVKKSATIYTVGHSTHPIEEFLEILKNFRIEKLIDVRTIPKSRHNPQFNKESLSRELPKHKIAYEHSPGLGGLRHPKKDSINLGWRNDSFRGYADYMQTEEFDENLENLMTEANQKRVAIMCAEAVPWRCHRSLIADALTVKGFEVHNIMDAKHETIHKLNKMAKRKAGHVYYPSDPDQLSLEF